MLIGLTGNRWRKDEKKRRGRRDQSAEKQRNVEEENERKNKWQLNFFFAVDGNSATWTCSRLIPLHLIGGGGQVVSDIRSSKRTFQPLPLAEKGRKKNNENPISLIEIGFDHWNIGKCWN